MSAKNDRDVLRKLATQVMEIANKPKQKERRELWRKLNSLKMVRPMVNVNGFMWWEEVYPSEETLECQHPACREAEIYFRQCIFHDWIGDDTVIEPWVVLRSVYGAPYKNTPEMGDLYWCSNTWGVEFKRKPSPEKRGAWVFDPVIVELDDFKKMTKPVHIIDEEKTAEHFNAVNDLIGDIMPVIMDRGPMIRTYGGSILHDLCLLRGLEQVYIDMIENPEWLHEVLSFMTESVRDLHAQAEAAGDLRLINQFNQSMPYCEELEDPSPDTKPVKRKELWHFFEGQEFTCVSPEMTDEFAIRYHKILAEEYALCAYGCCEDLTNKIPYLKKIKNLRTVAVVPWADIEKCAEQIQGDYVFSWRPDPSSTLCNGFDADFLRKTLIDGLEKSRGCNVEINLKDVHTIRKDINAVKEWTRVAMEVVENFYV
ncbi:MAG TPA: hypothetical protein GXX14_11535 [Clostridiaceae bacterium]|nr:hypothetical protein [Clostridiaceae bacterium]